MPNPALQHYEIQWFTHSINTYWTFTVWQATSHALKMQWPSWSLLSNWRDWYAKWLNMWLHSAPLVACELRAWSMSFHLGLGAEQASLRNVWRWTESSVGSRGGGRTASLQLPGGKSHSFHTWLTPQSLGRLVKIQISGPYCQSFWFSPLGPGPKLSLLTSALVMLCYWSWVNTLSYSQDHIWLYSKGSRPMLRQDLRNLVDAR